MSGSWWGRRGCPAKTELARTDWQEKGLSLGETHLLSKSLSGQGRGGAKGILGAVKKGSTARSSGGGQAEQSNRPGLYGDRTVKKASAAARFLLLGCFWSQNWPLWAEKTDELVEAAQESLTWGEPCPATRSSLGEVWFATKGTDLPKRKRWPEKRKPRIHAQATEGDTAESKEQSGR